MVALQNRGDNMFELPQKVLLDIKNYKENLQRFLKGDIKDAFFRGIRVPWGFYSQRGGKILMSRLRIPAGILTAKQLKAIAEAAEKFANGQLHITTRQDIQIHNVPFENSIKIIEYLKEYNISPRGGGGNTVRNITCCYLSGICPYEKIESYKFVWALTEYLLSLEQSYNLPRKFKIAFSGCENDCAFCGVNDLGFVATKGGFKVICGGGMGARSSVGKVLEENIELSDVGYVTKAVINVFDKHGDRRNRHHNRLRFLIEDIGWDKFVELYKKEFQKIKQEEIILLKLTDGLAELKNLDNATPIGCAVEQEYNEFLKFNIAKQKQPGYCYAEIRIPVGEVSSSQLIEISKVEDFIPEVIFRTSQRQNLVITNVPFNKIYYVYEKIKNTFKDFLYPNTILDVVSCKAATTCNLGICNAIDMAKEVVKELSSVLNTESLEKTKNIKININGCPNACGQHPIGTISFSGLARKVYGRTAPFYKVYFGGEVNAENTKLAEEVGIIPARSVPKFISELVSCLQQSLNIEHSTLNNLIQKYSFIPPYEEDKSYYIDFGKTEEFSLSGISQGECGAGVVDMIESDINSAKQSLIKAKENNYELTEIKNALLYSARALLVLKGIDPKNEIEIIENFIDKLIKSGVCSFEFADIENIYDKLQNNKVENVVAVYNYVEKLYTHIKETYELMDPNFNLPVRFLAENTSVKLQPQSQAVVYDLRGTPCPINYVKAKLKLDELKIGDLLEIYLDEGEPINNVPKSLQNDGQEILEIKNIENYYKVSVRKKV